MEHMDLVFDGIHDWLPRWGKAGKDTGLLEHKIVTFNASLMTLRNLEHFRNVIYTYIHDLRKITQIIRPSIWSATHSSMVIGLPQPPQPAEKDKSWTS